MRGTLRARRFRSSCQRGTEEENRLRERDDQALELTLSRVRLSYALRIFSVFLLPSMADTLKVRKVGNALGTILPPKVVDALHLDEGDELHVTYTPEGIMLTPYDSSFEETMDDARAFMQTHRNAFRELAK